MQEDAGQEIFLGRQPILDRRQRVVAYELLFRSEQADRAQVMDNLQASARVITYAFGDLGIGTALGRCDCYINVSRELIMSDVIELLPKGSVTLELLETVAIDDEVIQRCRELKRMGFKLALDDFVYDPVYEPLFESIDVVKIDLMQQGPAGIGDILQRLKRWPAKLLAEKVETPAQFNQCLEAGFGLFQGYYFARPHLVIGRANEPSKLTLLRLLGLIVSDAEVAELEQALKGDPGLCYNLLRLVNSVAMGVHHKITSIPHAIALLGRRQLQRWLQLLLYAQKKDVVFPSPLLQLAAVRGKVMERLAGLKDTDKDYHDRAFMTGIFSLLEALLELPLDEVLNHLPLADDVKSALLGREGELGQMLALAQMLEQGRLEQVAPLLEQLDITMDQLMEAQVEGLRWSNAIGESVHV